MDNLKSIIGKVATGATLSSDEAAAAFDSMMSGEATPSQMGGLLMALRVRGETVEEITGAVSAVRAKMLRVKAPGRRRRRGRHRRRRLRVGQRVDLRLLHRRRRRRARRQTRQSRAVVALGRRRRAVFAWGQDRHHARACRPLHRRGWHRLHVRAIAPSGVEERRPDPRRTGNTHHLQFAGAACPIPPASSGRWSAFFPSNGCSRWRRC